MARDHPAETPGDRVSLVARQVRGEMRLDTAEVDLRRSPELLASLRGQARQRRSAIVGIGAARDEARGFEVSTSRLTRLRDSTTLEPRSCIRRQAWGAALSSSSTSYQDYLRSSDLFAVEDHPQAHFRSTTIDTVDGVVGTVTGDLTLKGVTRPVILDVSYLGQTTDPWGNERLVFTATARINRHDWGVDWNMVLEAGGLVVSKEITLEIDVEFVRT